MLRVQYEAVEMPAGKPVSINEDRGTITVKIDEAAKVTDLLPELTAEMDRFLGAAEWFQMWGQEIVSARSIDSPVHVTYELSPLPSGPVVHVREHKGSVSVFVDRHASAVEFAGELTAVCEEFLAGCRWFQLWRGEIIT